MWICPKTQLYHLQNPCPNFAWYWISTHDLCSVCLNVMCCIYHVGNWVASYLKYSGKGYKTQAHVKHKQKETGCIRSSWFSWKATHMLWSQGLLLGWPNERAGYNVDLNEEKWQQNFCTTHFSKKKCETSTNSLPFISLTKFNKPG